jgi:hypothetical protein
MKPIEFPEYNKVYAKDQPEYQPLPVFKADTPEGHCISCWKLSFTERIRILMTGKLWVSLMTFNKPLTPSLFSTKKSDVLVTLHWAIKLRKKLLIPGTWKWNSWIRSITAKLEANF